MCNPLTDPGCIITAVQDALGKVNSTAADALLKPLADAITGSVGWCVQNMVTIWFHTPSTSADNPAVGHLQYYTRWLAGALAVGSLLVAAGRLALFREGRDAAQIGRGLVTLAVLSALGIPALVVLTNLGDAYSEWIINVSADGDFATKITLLIPAAMVAALSGAGAVAEILIGLAFVVSLFVQGLMLVAQGVGLTMLTGLLPVAAAPGVTRGGQAVRDRYLVWLLAFLLYKPAAATAYATAFWLIGKSKDLGTLLAGLLAIILAIFALPALLRLLNPAVAALTSGGTAAGVVGTAAGDAVGTLASGAIRTGAGAAFEQLSGGKGGGEGGSPTGASSAPSGGDPAGSAPSASQSSSSTTAAASTGDPYSGAVVATAQTADATADKVSGAVSRTAQRAADGATDGDP